MKIVYPHDNEKEYFIEIPDEWLGEHHLKLRKINDALKESKYYNAGILGNFLVAIGLCDNYHLPGLDGKPASWDLEKVGLRKMAWVVSNVITHKGYGYESCFVVPKKKSSNIGNLLNLMSTAGSLPTMAH